MTKHQLSDDELSRIEREHPEGLSSTQIVNHLTKKGVSFTGSTLRKYVQLGLLPRSRRVGMKGKHKGSQGLYPASVVRQVQRLKSMMETHTIEEIQRDFFFIRGDVEALETSLEKIFGALTAALKARSKSEGLRSLEARKDTMQRDLADTRALAAELVAKVIALEARLTMQARLQREAV
ncbi:MAG: hypothetical protein ABI332_05995 [Polyangiaceae bacterium]